MTAERPGASGRASDPLPELVAVFEPPGPAAAAMLRLTEAGIFLATPLEVLVSALALLFGEAPLPDHEELAVLDAGSGDGRVLAALGLIAPQARRLRLVGIERDELLHALGVRRLRDLARRPAWPRGRGAELLCGDWSAAATLEPLGLALGDFDLVLNYPDGNEARLASLVAERGSPRTRLVLLRPDAAQQLPPLRLEWERRVSPGTGGADWQLSTWRRE